ncbi:MAG: glutamyl-tRNA reductase [Chitinophagaceae bacterium]
MHGTNNKDISNFYLAGINYKKTDAAIRGQYAVNKEQYASLLAIAPLFGINEVFILSTCNRTEIYGFAEDPSHLIHLLCSQTEGETDTFKELAYTKKGIHAVQHFFNVAAGLDSQILGDYEIVGQIKQSVKFAREHNFIDTYSDRLVNTVLQSSKMIRNQTDLSGGTVSVSFAAIQYIKRTVKNLFDKKILLLGIGKIGSNTCKNLVDYLQTTNITLINRTPGKAESLAKELGLHYASHEDSSECVKEADIIIVATNANHPTILKSDLQNSGKKLIIDLSVPYNVEEEAKQLANITLVNVDELSKIKDDTIKKREAAVPMAKVIINTYIEEFLAWNDMRKHVPVLKAVKTKLQEITSCGLFFPITTTSVAPVYTEKIQRVINGMAIKMREQNQRGCHYIEAINEFMATGSN